MLILAEKEQEYRKEQTTPFLARESWKATRSSHWPNIQIIPPLTGLSAPSFSETQSPILYEERIELNQWFLLEYELKDLLKYRLLGFTPRVSDSVGLEGAQKFAFLTGFQGMLILQEPPL